jgi:hypothetical protein
VLAPDRRTAGLVRRLEAGAVPLGAVLEFYSGLIGRAGQASVVAAPGSDVAGPTAPLIESGRRLRRYAVDDGGRRVRLDPALFKSGYDPARYRAPKIFLNQTGATLKACVDRRGWFCLNNLHIGSLLDGRWGLDALAGLLNSTLLGWYWQTVTMEAGRALAQTDIDMLHTVPLPTVDFDVPEDRRRRWWGPLQDCLRTADRDRLAAVLRRIPPDERSLALHDALDACARTLADRYGRGDHACAALERCCDSVVCQLYGLSEDDVGIVEGSFKQQRGRGGERSRCKSAGLTGAETPGTRPAPTGRGRRG